MPRSVVKNSKKGHFSSPPTPLYASPKLTRKLPQIRANASPQLASQNSNNLTAQPLTTTQALLQKMDTYDKNNFQNSKEIVRSIDAKLKSAPTKKVLLDTINYYLNTYNQFPQNGTLNAFLDKLFKLNYLEDARAVYAYIKKCNKATRFTNAIVIRNAEIHGDFSLALTAYEAAKSTIEIDKDAYVFNLMIRVAFANNQLDVVIDVYTLLVKHGYANQDTFYSMLFASNKFNQSITAEGKKYKKKKFINELFKKSLEQATIDANNELRTGQVSKEEFYDRIREYKAKTYNIMLNNNCDNLEKAKQIYREAISSKCYSTVTFTSMIKMAAQFNDIKTAEKVLNEALKLNSADISARNCFLYAVSKCKSKVHLPKAVTIYNEAVRNGDANDITHKSMIDALVSCGNDLYKAQSIWAQHHEPFDLNAGKEIDLHGDSYGCAYLGLLDFFQKHSDNLTEFTVITGQGNHSRHKESDTHPTKQALDRFIGDIQSKFYVSAEITQATNNPGRFHIKLNPKQLTMENDQGKEVSITKDHQEKSHSSEKREEMELNEVFTEEVYEEEECEPYEGNDEDLQEEEEYDVEIDGDQDEEEYIEEYDEEDNIDENNDEDAYEAEELAAGDEDPDDDLREDDTNFEKRHEKVEETSRNKAELSSANTTAQVQKHLISEKKEKVRAKNLRRAKKNNANSRQESRQESNYDYFKNFVKEKAAVFLNCHCTLFQTAVMVTTTAAVTALVFNSLNEQQCDIESIAERVRDMQCSKP